MNNLIKLETLSDGTVVVDSRIVAGGLGIDHLNFIDTLIKYRSVIEPEFGVFRFETCKPHPSSVGGRPTRFAWLNEDQISIAATFSRNTDQVIQFKVRLVKAFKLLREGKGDRLSRLEQELTEIKALLKKPSRKPILPANLQLSEVFDAIGIVPCEATLPIKEIWQLIEQYYIALGVLALVKGDRTWTEDPHCIKGANQVYDAIKQVYPNAKRVHIGNNRKGIYGLEINR